MVGCVKRDNQSVNDLSESAVMTTDYAAAEDSAYNEGEYYGNAVAATDSSFAPMVAEAGGIYADKDFVESTPPMPIGGDGVVPVTISATDRKMIRMINLQAETKDLTPLVNTIKVQTAALGGYVENMNQSEDGGEYQMMYERSGVTYIVTQKNAWLTLRIPKDQTDSFLNFIDGSAYIYGRSENVTDVTLQYVDIDSRNKSLRVEQERLMELLGQSADLEVILRLENRLSEVRYEIERNESTLRSYDNQVDYSTVTINIREVAEYTKPAAVATSRIAKIGREFVDKCKEAGYGALTALLWVISIVPYLLVAALIILAIVLIIRRIIKSLKQRRAKAAAKEAVIKATPNNVAVKDEDSRS
jgi:hypothetical protein